MEPKTQVKNIRGIYIVIMTLHNDTFIQARKRKWQLRTGTYLYFGSARGQTSTSLNHRIARHVRQSKKCFWHIDYLTTSPCIEIVDIWYTFDPDVTECSLLRRIYGDLTFGVIINGFGSSDCPNKCQGHLLFLPSEVLFSLNRRFSSSGLQQWDRKPPRDESSSLGYHR
ncbi:MAG: DUF123 domain-containing protein [Candidatus Thorarchaeota archaeon]